MDWVKMRTNLYRDPKIIWIADCLYSQDGQLAKSIEGYLHVSMAVTRNVTRNATIGALVTLWGTVRHKGKRAGNDLVLLSAQIFTVDEIADLPGLGAAMVEVGWLIEHGDTLIFPNFFEALNYDPAEESKAKNLERQRRYREKKRNAFDDVTRDVTVTSESNVREEKRREEKSKEIQREDLRSILFSKDPDLEKEAPKKPKPDPIPKIEFAPFVFLTEAEHAKLIAEHGSDFVKRCIEKLSAYIESNPSAKTKRNGHNAAATFRSWVIRAVTEESSRVNGSRFPPWQQPSKLLTPEECAEIERKVLEEERLEKEKYGQRR